MAQRTVDAHNHWYPKEYLAYLCSRKEVNLPGMRTHDRGYYPGGCGAPVGKKLERIFNLSPMP